MSKLWKALCKWAYEAKFTFTVASNRRFKVTHLYRTKVLLVERYEGTKLECQCGSYKVLHDGGELAEWRLSQYSCRFCYNESKVL